MTTPNLDAVINTIKNVFPNGEHLGKIKAQRKLNTDDMWTMYCIARYTDKGACSGQQRGL